MIPRGWLVAGAFLALYLLLVALGQGIENYAAMQGGFRRDVPQTMCSPITGRTLPVDMWAEYDRRE